MLCTQTPNSVSAITPIFTGLPFTQKLKRHVKAARFRYQQYLEEAEKTKLNEQKAKKRTAIEDDITKAVKKKQVTESTMETLRREADELPKEAERKLLSPLKIQCLQGKAGREGKRKVGAWRRKSMP